jgi:hypothetical protein
MARQRAEYVLREAYLWSPFGRKMASRYFGNAIFDRLPRYKRGTRKGEIQAKVAWVKCERGGFVPKAFIGRSYTETREGKVVEVHLMTDEFDEDSRIIQTWRHP